VPPEPSVPQPSVSADTLAVIATQLGRVPRGVVGVAASCQCGAPMVALTAPRLPDQTPFPTIYYLTHPGLTAAISRLEADGLMKQFNERLVYDAGFAEAYRAAHQAYLADRVALEEQLGLEVPEIAGVTAGGMPNRIKCLHALAAHSLAAGSGVNPVGDEVLQQIGYTPEKCYCQH